MGFTPRDFARSHGNVTAERFRQYASIGAADSTEGIMKKKPNRAQEYFAISFDRVEYSTPSSAHELFYVETKEEQIVIEKAYLDWIKDPVPEHRIVEFKWINPLAAGNTPRTGTVFVDLSFVIGFRKCRQSFS